MSPGALGILYIPLSLSGLIVQCCCLCVVYWSVSLCLGVVSCIEEVHVLENVHVLKNEGPACK